MERETKSQIYDLDRLQEMMPISKTVLRREINRGRLRAYKIGGKFYVTETDFKAYLESALVVAQ